MPAMTKGWPRRLRATAGATSFDLRKRALHRSWKRMEEQVASEVVPPTVISLRHILRAMEVEDE